MYVILYFCVSVSVLVYVSVEGEGLVGVGGLVGDLCLGVYFCCLAAVGGVCLGGLNYHQKHEHCFRHL